MKDIRIDLFRAFLIENERTGEFYWTLKSPLKMELGSGYTIIIDATLATMLEYKEKNRTHPDGVRILVKDADIESVLRELAHPGELAALAEQNGQL